MILAVARGAMTGCKPTKNHDEIFTTDVVFEAIAHR
jgi:hypothetical protein